jgi:hypothetical protein
VSGGAVSFCVGTGRCGTTFLVRLAELEPAVAASHERLRLAATFHMFCKWHGIAVDPAGFLVDRDAAVRDDLAAHRVSFEASALLSHSIDELFARFAARFVLLVRSPRATVASFAARGWFLQPIAWGDASRPPSLREGMEPRHFFGRNLPRGEAAYARWCALSQVGRIAWFWQARIHGILDQLARVPATHRRIVRLEDLDFDGYVELARFLGWDVTLSRDRFAALAASKPNASASEPAAIGDGVALAELAAETGSLAQALGYDAPEVGVQGPLPGFVDVLAARGAAR